MDFHINFLENGNSKITRDISNVLHNFGNKLHHSRLNGIVFFPFSGS